MVIKTGFDIGSGAVKIFVGDVEGDRIKVLFEKQIEVLVRHEVECSPDHSISHKKLLDIQAAIEQLTNEGQEKFDNQLGNFIGVATAVYREATNGKEIIQQLVELVKFPIVIVSQRIEGYLGYMTAVQAGGAFFPEINPSNIIAWDSGAASFQITTMEGHANVYNLQIYEGPLGSSKITAMMINKIQNKNFNITKSVNPATIEECKAFYEHTKEFLRNQNNYEESVAWLKPKSQEASVVAIGGNTSAFAGVLQTKGLHVFTIDDVWDAVHGLVGKSDKDLEKYPQPEMLIPKLILVIVVMEILNFPRVHFAPSTGCTGLLFFNENTLPSLRMS